MSVSIHIPTALRPYADRQATVEAEGGDVAELLQHLVHSHPQLRPHLFTADGQLRSFVNVYVNDEDIRYTGSERTPVKPSDTLSIIPSIAGGCCAGRC